MPLRAVRSLSLADQAFEQLASEIMSGRYAPGANLPAERSLAEIFGVNRHVVREALKRLEQVGLVKVSQGGGTVALDFRRTAGLDLLALMAAHARGGDDTASYWLAVLEMRAAIGADMARLCALRADKQVRKDLVAIAREMSDTKDGKLLFTLEVRFWDRVLDGAGNIAYRLAYNSMIKGAYAMRDAAAQWSIHEAKSSGYRLRIAEAIAGGDAETAERETRSAMRAVVNAFEKRMHKRETDTPPTKKAAAAKRAAEK